jgi:tetratricopeptide (TPR) repeat protein
MPLPPEGRFERYQAALQQGHDHLRQAKLKQALTSYRSAAELGEKRALPHVLAAGVLIRLGRIKEALSEYDKALALDPNDRSAVAGKAGTLRAAGRAAEAAKLDAKLDELEEEAEAQRLASAVAGAGGVESPEGLLVTAERMVAQGRREGAITAWLGASERYAAAGQLDAALDTCLRALLADSGSPRVHLELSRLYFLRGWHQRGADHLLLLDKLLALAPNDTVRVELVELAAKYDKLDTRLGQLGQA